MNKYYLQNPIYSLLLVVISFTSCNGQIKKSLPKDSLSKSKTTTIGQPKLVKTQGTDQYQNVHCGLQDKASNLWFGTTGEGVYRYDGKSFTNFTMKDGLNSNTVWSILEDKSGNIWFGTADGICRYDGKSFTSIPINVTYGVNFQSQLSLNNNPYAKNAVWSIMQDRSGKLWFGTDEGLYYYNPAASPKTEKIAFTRFLDNYNIINKNNLQLKMIQCMLEDKNGNLWFGSGLNESEGLCRFDGKTLTRFKPNGDGWVRSMLQDKKGNLWFACRVHGLALYDGKTFTNFTEKEGLSNNGAGNLLEDKAGKIWFAAEKTNVPENEKGGVWYFDGKFYKNFTIKDGLINNSIWCIIEDKSGNLWIGSRNMGLCRYDGKTFTKFSE